MVVAGRHPGTTMNVTIFKKTDHLVISQFFRALLHGTRDDSNGRHLPEHSVSEHKLQVWSLTYSVFH